MPAHHLVPSSDIELETGFGKDLLRKWRQRFGYPLPVTQADGKAGYTRETISDLLAIRRLLQGGFRPSQVVGKTRLELERLQRAIAEDAPAPHWNASTHRLIERLKKTDVAGLEALLDKDRAKGSLTEFVLNTLVPLVAGVGDAWSRKDLEIYHAHLCSSAVERRLHAGILSSKPKRGYPRILFASPPEESHVLGLLMAEAVLADQGAHTVSIGVHVPFNDLKMAVASCKADVLALSFSFAYPARRVGPTLVHLRRLLPRQVEIWAGGTGAAGVKRPPKGVRLFLELQESVRALLDLARLKRRVTIILP